MNYKIRMLDELLYISNKITRLNCYLENRIIKENEGKEDLMTEQLKHMEAYRDILQERVENELVDICSASN